MTSDAIGIEEEEKEKAERTESFNELAQLVTKTKREARKLGEDVDEDLATELKSMLKSLNLWLAENEDDPSVTLDDITERKESLATLWSR
eukprot:CAMPEP_0168523968 /NCGR_PEP_ID=MMETSP0405-20121227/10335_1 /TAXON_ID=498012 /ORGANISM="Trichosphaerium sp, Strain Am-I-7 wt" /LENGTH=89 /DNA_ID=CAMNT_0008546015 /DNA_START=321 /DNA_END=586 /DNA_ORIENTATION=-